MVSISSKPFRYISSTLQYLTIAAALFLGCAEGQAGGATAAPSFDVATVKLVPPDAVGRPAKGFIGVFYSPDGIEVSQQTLPELLCYAYGYKTLRFDGQIAGLPEWANKERYDIVAKMSPTDSVAFQKLNKEEQDRSRQQMLQSLLAERFSLTVHRGSKEVPVYDLVVAKGGSKLKDAATDPLPPLGKDANGKPITGMRDLKDTAVAQAFSMSSLAGRLSDPSSQVGRPVLDKTGLTGTYNFTLDWSVYSARAAAEGEATSIFDALGKIGLKLQPSTGSFETIVIDYASRPTPN